jgi:hypothetical protein
MVWKIGPVNEYEAQSAIIPIVGIIIRKEYELRQQCHFIFISRTFLAVFPASLPGVSDGYCQRALVGE